MPVQRVIIVRHGETDYNVEHRWQGHLDIPLNAMGKTQAEKLAKFLKDERIDAIYASDLARAFGTADAIARIKDLQVIPEPRLREINVGVLQGLSRAQMDVSYPDEHHQWRTDINFVIPNGESRQQVQDRAYAAWQDLTEQLDMKTVVLVTHGGTMRLLLRKLFPKQAELSFKNTSVSIIDRHETGDWYIVSLNQIAHLE